MKTPDLPPGPLTMREACALMGWHDDDGKITPRLCRKLRRRLLTASKSGRTYVYDGNERGDPSWTTAALLRDAGLLPDRGPGIDIDTLADGMADGIARLRHEAHDACTRVDRVEKQVVDLTALVMKWEKLLQAMRKRLGVE